MPQEHQKMKISKLDKQEHEEDLKLPEVSTETFETVKADLVDVDMKANSCDKDIERRLTKLKFFNQTWLKDLSKTKTMMGKRKDHDVPNAAHDAVEESDDKVPAVGVRKAEPKAEHHDAILVVSEPVTSSKEDIDAFKIGISRKYLNLKFPRNQDPDFELCHH